MNLKDKTLLVVDNGLYVEMACQLAQSFKRTLYFTNWRCAAARSNTRLIGDGLPDLERIHDLWDNIEQADLIAFLDVNDGDTCEYLRRQGKRVWGAGIGEQLELDRIKTKKILKDSGLPVGEYAVVEGIGALRKHLQKHDDVYVKPQGTRGDFETFHAENYDLIETRLDELEHELGAAKFIYPFLCEKGIPDAIEIGWDGYTIDGQFPDTALFGYEIKDQGYLGSVLPYSSLAEPIREVNEALSTILKMCQYRGFLSTEMRITEDGTPYVIDLTCRCASPPNEIYQMMFDNLAEIVWEGAKGKLVDFQPNARFGALATIYSEWAEKNWQPIHCPEDVRPWVKLRNFTRINDTDCVIPQEWEMAEIGAVVGLGDTIQESVDTCCENACQVMGYGVKCETDSFNAALEQIHKGEEYGVKFCEDEIPEAIET